MAHHLAIDCGRQRGFPFVQAFLFEPKGTVLYVGDLGKIREKTSTLPTCHGVVMFWQFNQITRKMITLFGVNRHVPGFDLHHANRCHSAYVPDAIKPMLKERMKYILTYTDAKGNVELVNTWRRMPSCYIGDVFEKHLNDRTVRQISNAKHKVFKHREVISSPEAEESAKTWAAMMTNAMPWLSKDAVKKMLGFNAMMINDPVEE